MLSESPKKSFMPKPAVSHIFLSCLERNILMYWIHHSSIMHFFIICYIAWKPSAEMGFKLAGVVLVTRFSIWRILIWMARILQEQPDPLQQWQKSERVSRNDTHTSNTFKHPADWSCTKPLHQIYNKSTILHSRKCDERQGSPYSSQNTDRARFRDPNLTKKGHGNGSHRDGHAHPWQERALIGKECFGLHSHRHLISNNLFRFVQSKQLGQKAVTVISTTPNTSVLCAVQQHLGEIHATRQIWRQDHQ